MSLRKTLLLAAAAVLAGLALAAAGYGLVAVRAGGSGVTLAPGATITPSPRPTSTQSPPATPKQWLVARALRTLTVYKRAEAGAPVRVLLPEHNRFGLDTVMLINTTVERGGRTWYEVWLPVPPNGSRGWIPAKNVTIYTVSSEIVIDTSRRVLQVVRDDKIVGEFKVAIGRRDLPTPTGFFYVTEKLKPADPNTVFGVLAIGISAFQPKLPSWPGSGQVAIHGTNQVELIGRAVSQGCVRMRNQDILEVSRLVRTGSPVVIKK
jgi:lipoprotein-anchoring transpeptidase ErfK/SrfK